MLLFSTLYSFSYCFVFSPSTPHTYTHTRYDVRALYSTYDVTHLLRVGNGSINALAISASGGWYTIP